MTAIIRHEIWPKARSGPWPLDVRIDSIFKRSRREPVAVFMAEGELKSCSVSEPCQMERALACGAKRLVGIYDERASLEQIDADVRWAVEAMR